MPVDVILRQAIQRSPAGDFHYLLPIGNISVEGGLLLGQLVVQLFQFGAGGVVLVHAGQAKLQQVPGDEMARGGVRPGEVQGAQRLVDAAIQRERCDRGTGLTGHFRRGVAELRVRMYLLHEPREIGGLS